MRPFHVTLLSLSALLLTAACQSSPVNPSTGTASQENYERIKALEGDWYLVSGVRLGKEVEANMDDPFITYEVSSAGHSVIEKLFAGQPGEMTSVYYMDKGLLKMDHYCSLGNQPRMFAIPGAEGEAAFAVGEVGNFPDEDALYISSHSLEFNGPNELTVYWGATEAGAPSGGSMYKVKKL